MNRFENNIQDTGSQLDIDQQTAAQQDMLAEEILDNMHFTPIGQVLMRIASLPEMRQKKVLDVRQQICDGSYDVNNRLDAVLEKVLEEI